MHVLVPGSGDPHGHGPLLFDEAMRLDVELTAPYMRNGVLGTLEEVLRFYDAGRSENPNVAQGGRRRGGDRRGGP